MANIRILLSTLIGLFLILIGFFSYHTVESYKRMSNKNQLEIDIRDNKKFESQQITYQSFRPDQIDEFVNKYEMRLLSIQDSKEEDNQIATKVAQYRKELEESKDTLSYFYMKKKFNEYFISVKDEKCRLGIKNIHPLTKIATEMNLMDISSLYKEHFIDPNICNSLFGYGISNY